VHCPPFTFGGAGRTLPDVRGPGLKNIDFSLFKNFALIERVSLQFRAESFNLTNTPSFSDPNQNFSNNAFGRIYGTSNAARQVQVGLKLVW
jgi:hypothetical protein